MQRLKLAAHARTHKPVRRKWCVRYGGFGLKHEFCVRRRELMLGVAALAGCPSRDGKQGGDFLLLAQMPDPQPAWAQQYNADMQPVWSRQFEPTAISGRESQAAMWALLKLATATGDKKYLAPVAKAITYLRTVLLPGNKLARFYELNTNKPLYFERGPGGLPVTEAAAGRVLALPVHPYLSAADQDRIIAAILAGDGELARFEAERSNRRAVMGRDTART